MVATFDDSEGAAAIRMSHEIVIGACGTTLLQSWLQSNGHAGSVPSVENKGTNFDRGSSEAAYRLVRSIRPAALYITLTELCPLSCS